MRYQFLIFTCLSILFLSCKKEESDTECSDYFDANREIITGVWDWFPYDRGEHVIEYIDDSGITTPLNIIRSERVTRDVIGPIFKCPEVSISPRLEINRGDRSLFTAWAQGVEMINGEPSASFGVSVILTGIINLGSVLTKIEDMDSTGITVNLRGEDYQNVIVFRFTSNTEQDVVLYLQKGIGILGYEENNELILIKD